MAELFYRLARPRELAFLPWSTPMAQAWLAGLDPAIRDRSMHLKQPDGTLLSGNQVFAATLACVRGLKWLGWLSRKLPPFSAFLEWTYRWVAGHREFLSRLVPYRQPVVREPQVQ